MTASETQSSKASRPTDAQIQSVFDRVLQESLDTEIQIVEAVALDEAARSGLYDILRSEIVEFLDYFFDAHSWKRLYVASRLNNLQKKFESCSVDERRIRVMEFAAQMSHLVQDTFRQGSTEYRRAMTGLGRIMELLLSWQVGEKLVDFPKYKGKKIDGDPIEFLRKNYAKWIASGRLSQISLRESDEKLLNALKYELRKAGRSLSEVVPPGIRR